MSQPDPFALELLRLRDQVADLIVDQRYLMRAQLDRADRRAGLVLFPIAAELVGGFPFTGPGLMAAALNTRTPAGKAAVDVLDDISTDSGGLRAFGRLLSRLEGVVLAGFRLQAAGETSEGRRWRLTRVSDPE